MAVSSISGNVYVAEPGGVDVFTPTGDDKGDLNAPVYYPLDDAIAGISATVGTVESVAVYPIPSGIDIIYVGGSNGIAEGVFFASFDVPFLAVESVPQGNFGSLAVSQDGTLLYASGASQNEVFDANGVVNPQALPGSSGTLAISPNDQYVYVASGTSGTLEVLKRDLSNNQFSPLPTLQDGVNGVRGLTGATGITVSRDGKYVYVTSGSGNSLAIFGVQSDGTLQLDQVIHGGPGLDDPSGVATDTKDDNVYVSSLAGNRDKHRWARDLLVDHFRSAAAEHSVHQLLRDVGVESHDRRVRRYDQRDHARDRQRLECECR